MRVASWSDLARFFKADGWTEIRRGGDFIYEKQLPTGELLRSARSSGKSDETIGRDMFKEILRVQLRVSIDAFWKCVDGGDAAVRPSAPLPTPPISLPAWMALRLEKELGLRGSDLRGMTPEEGQRRLNEFRSRPR